MLVANPTIRAEHCTSRVALTNDPLNACRVLYQYRRLCHPDMKFLYTHPCLLSKDKRNQKDGFRTVLFSKNRPMGVNFINRLTRPLAEKAGCANYNSITGNSIRRYVITKLANDMTLSQKEVQEHARHRSATAQNHYI